MRKSKVLRGIYVVVVGLKAVEHLCISYNFPEEGHYSESILAEEGPALKAGCYSKYSFAESRQLCHYWPYAATLAYGDPADWPILSLTALVQLPS